MPLGAEGIGGSQAAARLAKGLHWWGQSEVGQVVLSWHPGDLKQPLNHSPAPAPNPSTVRRDTWLKCLGPRGCIEEEATMAWRLRRVCGGHSVVDGMPGRAPSLPLPGLVTHPSSLGPSYPGLEEAPEVL